MYLFLRKHHPPHSNSQKTTTEKSILILKTCKRHLILHFIFCNSFYSSGTVWNTETVCRDVSTHHSPTASSLHVKPSFRAGSFRRNHLQWCRKKKYSQTSPIPINLTVPDWRAICKNESKHQWLTTASQGKETKTATSWNEVHEYRCRMA